MRRWILFSISAMLIWNLSALFANAQVWFGPGVIQAPYVRIEFDHGGVHVQAPFVNLYAQAPRACETGPNIASAPQDRLVNEADLISQLLAAAGKLNEALAQYGTGATWQHYLATGTGELLSSEAFARLDSANADSTAALQDFSKLLGRYDATTINNKFRTIAALPEFKRVRELLAGYVAQRQTAFAETDRKPPPPGDETIGGSAKLNSQLTNGLRRTPPATEELPAPASDSDR